MKSNVKIIGKIIQKQKFVPLYGFFGFSTMKSIVVLIKYDTIVIAFMYNDINV
jgi:hypothetical protein